VGYAVVLGFGAIFAVVTSFLVSSKNIRLKPLSKFLAQTCLLAQEKKRKTRSANFVWNQSPTRNPSI
jgi:hypothetical protein